MTFSTSLDNLEPETKIYVIKDQFLGCALAAAEVTEPHSSSLLWAKSHCGFSFAGTAPSLLFACQ